MPLLLLAVPLLLLAKLPRRLATQLLALPLTPAMLPRPLLTLLPPLLLPPVLLPSKLHLPGLSGL